MIPQALARAGTVSADPGQYWYVILHDSFGMLAVILAIVLVITFLVKKGMPLNLLRRARPLMITVLFLWIVTFVLGAYIFVGGLMTV
jgi:Ca2+/Na+ antiporter